MTGVDISDTVWLTNEGQSYDKTHCLWRGEKDSLWESFWLLKEITVLQNYCAITVVTSKARINSWKTTFAVFPFNHLTESRNEGVDKIQELPTAMIPLSTYMVYSCSVWVFWAEGISSTASSLWDLLYPSNPNSYNCWYCFLFFSSPLQ